MENNETGENVKQPTQKLAYSPPELKSYGDAVEITLGSLRTSGDGGGGHSRN